MLPRYWFHITASHILRTCLLCAIAAVLLTCHALYSSGPEAEAGTGKNSPGPVSPGENSIPAVGVGADTTLRPESGSGDSLSTVRSLPSSVRARSSLALAAYLADSLGAVEFTPGRLRRSGAYYIDDFLRLDPFLVSGDSLGNGYAKKLSPLGAGFDQVRYFLNGMPLTDPLTGGVDLRMVSCDVLERVLILPFGAFSGARGGAQEVHLVTRRADVPVACSRMGIFSGSYQINKLGGSLRRRLFDTAALHVDINKIEQRTEDLEIKVEQIQYFTRLEKRLGSGALLSVDGLFFSNDRKPGGISGKLKDKNTHIQLALTGMLGESAGYRVAYQYAASQHPFDMGSGLGNLRARSDGYQANIVFRPRANLALGFDLQGERSRIEESPEDFSPTGSVSRHKLLGFLRCRIPGGMRVHSSLGLRTVSGTVGRKAVADIGLSKDFSQNLAGFISWKTEAAYPGGLTAERPAVMGTISSAEAGLQLELEGRGVLRAGLIHRRVDDLVPAAFMPYMPAEGPAGSVDYTVRGLYYRYEGRLWSIFSLRASGVELFDPPVHVAYVPGRHHTAALSLSRECLKGDLEAGLQAEMTYEGELLFPAGTGPAARLEKQAGRVNFGGSALLRIVNLTIYLRLDHLMSDYYNGIDPLSLPGPRVVFGLNWMFFN
ncbi:MAG: TonB-dependent receptor [Gemmatimonadota bacterium]|nr:TonB-dependent receptor [Gemmatimonadota bacterium]